MQPKTLVPRERALHRLIAQHRRQRGLRLNAHIFLAAKRAAVLHQFHGNLFARPTQHRGNLPLIVENALPLREHFHLRHRTSENIHCRWIGELLHHSSRP